MKRFQRAVDGESTVTRMQVNGLMRAVESVSASSNRRELTRYKQKYIKVCDEWTLCVNLGGTAGFRSCPLNFGGQDFLFGGKMVLDRRWRT